MEDSRQPSTSGSHPKCSSAAPKSSKLPTNIIQPSPFVDTLAIQALFLQMPVTVMLCIHGLFITSSLSGVSFTSTRAIFGWSPSSKTSGSNISSGSSFGSSTPASTTKLICKALAVDVAVALMTLYVTPLLRRIVLMFACSIVASTLGGGPRVFTNAIYATTLAEFIRLIWEKLSFYLFASDVGVASSNAYAFDSDFVVSSFQGPEDFSANKNYNTLTSIWALIPTVIRFIRHLDWVRELPTILFQVVAVHVIGLGLLPYIRKVFPDRSDKSVADDDSSSHNDSFIDNSLLNQSLTGFSSSEPPTDINLLSGATTELSLLGKDTNESSQNLNSSTTNFDFLYAPSVVKKNKRLAMVRSNQPLWSTLASSIVLAARHETEDATDAGISELEKNGLTNTSVLNEAGHCYVRYIFENVVAFETVGFDPSLRGSFSVHVNGIQWPQVSIQPFIDEPSDHSPTRDDPFLVIVYGLTPMTQYDIEILCIYKQDVLPHSCLKICVSTISWKHADTNGTPGTPARPLSPVTTLLDTLATTQMTLSEEKSRLKRLRKDHTKRLISLRQEIDATRSKIDSTDKNDERNRRKVLSLREAVRQLEEEIELINRLTDAVILKQNEIEEEFRTKEIEWKEHMSQFEEREKQERDIRLDLSRANSELEDQLASIMSKRDKLKTKNQRLESDIERIEEEITLEIQQLMQARNEEREKKLDRRRRLEEEFSVSITKMENGVEHTRKRTAEILAGPIMTGPMPAYVQSTVSLPDPTTNPPVVSPNASSSESTRTSPNVSDLTLARPGTH